jgi:hypothetical protein
VFDPVEFLAVARGLIDERGSGAEFRDTRAARVRTAYGRAYYALYLLVREELVHRHHILPRQLHHGAVYTNLQSPRAASPVRQLGRELQRLYTLRQKADYELAPDAGWEAQLENERAAAKLVALAADWAASQPRLDFSPVVPLFRP